MTSLASRLGILKEAWEEEVVVDIPANHGYSVWVLERKSPPSKLEDDEERKRVGNNTIGLGLVDSNQLPLLP
jgi:hypothetical protein